MLRLLIYGYTTGVRSSRAIERRLADDVAFRFLAAGQAPDFRSIARFRRRHLDALADLFTQSLHLVVRMRTRRDAVDQRKRPGAELFQGAAFAGLSSSDHVGRGHCVAWHRVSL
jgi:hypothetical protein